MDDTNFKICVHCFTFNQSKYIVDALNGFVMQQTNIPFVCIIIDDASTDGEQEVIRAYFDQNFDICNEKIAFKKNTENAYVMYAQHKDNKNCYFAISLLKENHYSVRRSKKPYMQEWQSSCKYVAICEGDDYWTDPHKLQKQADFLDANPQCSLTYHACKNVFSTPCKVNGIYAENVKQLYLDVDLVDYPFQTATVMYRKKIIDSELYKKATAIGCTFGDAILYLTASRFGTIEGINEQMSVYRRHEGGISQHMYDMDKLWKNFRDWQNVALLFGGEIGEKIKEVKLGCFIYYAITNRKYRLALKMLYSSIFKTPDSIAYGLKLSYNYYYHRLFK